MGLWQRMIERLKPTAGSPEERRNAWLFALEAPFSQLPFSVGSFYALFAIQLGASNTVVGWLTSGPALVNLLWIVPAGALVQASRNYVRPFALGAFLQRLLLASLALVVFLPTDWRPWALVALVMITSVPYAIRNLAFQATVGEIFSSQHFNRYVGLRWAIMSVSDVATMPLLGRLMDIIRFPLNFQLLFGGTGLITLLAIGLILQLQVPAHPQPARRAGESAERPTLRQMWNYYRGFILFELALLVSYLAVNASVPLYRIYWVRDLHATGIWVGALAAAASVGTMLGTLAWGRLNLGKQAKKVIFAAAAMYFGLNPLLTASLGNLGLLLALGVVIGLAAGGAELAIFNRMLRLSPRARRPLFISLHNLVANGAAFVGPLISTRLADQWGTRPALALMGLLGLAGAVLIYFLSWGKTPDEADAEAGEPTPA